MLGLDGCAVSVARAMGPYATSGVVSLSGASGHASQSQRAASPHARDRDHARRPSPSAGRAGPACRERAGATQISTWCYAPPTTGGLSVHTGRILIHLLLVAPMEIRREPIQPATRTSSLAWSLCAGESGASWAKLVLHWGVFAVIPRRSRPVPGPSAGYSSRSAPALQGLTAMPRSGS